MDEVEPVSVDLEKIVSKVFMKCIELVGGLRKLAELRSLTWLPSMARASFAVVLKDMFHKTEEEIAKELGTSKQAVGQMLRANPDVALEHAKSPEKTLKTHIAGGLARKAYELVKEEVAIDA